MYANAQWPHIKSREEWCSIWHMMKRKKLQLILKQTCHSCLETDSWLNSFKITGCMVGHFSSNVCCAPCKTAQICLKSYWCHHITTDTLRKMIDVHTSQKGTWSCHCLKHVLIHNCVIILMTFGKLTRMQCINSKISAVKMLYLWIPGNTYQ